MNSGNDNGSDFFNEFFHFDNGQGSQFYEQYSSQGPQFNNDFNANQHYRYNEDRYYGSTESRFYENSNNDSDFVNRGDGDYGYEESEANETDEASNKGDDGYGEDYRQHFEFDTTFSSFEQAFDHSNEIAYKLGFHLVKVKYQPKHCPPYNVVKCERHGKYTSRAKDPANPQRATATKRFNCPFDLRMVNVAEGSWVVRPKCGLHNHELGSYLEGHRQRAKLNDEQKGFLKGLWQSKMKPGKVRNAFTRKYPDQPPPVIKQIYNQNANFSAEDREGRNSIQYMLHLAGQANYFCEYTRHPDTKALTNVFMAHPEAIKMFKTWPYVVLIDSTYKTNKYDLILVECVGVTPVGNSFLIGYALIKKEDDTGYTWVLETLKSLLEPGIEPNAIITDHEGGLMKAIPLVFTQSRHLLCLWHIYNAVEAYATNLLNNGVFGKSVAHGDWKSVIEAKSWDECQYNWDIVKKKHKNRPRLVTYLEGTWWKHIDKFGKSFTDAIMHFGNTSTSRVESAHAVLKMWFGSASLTLDSIWKRADLMMKGQHIEIRKALENSLSKVLIANSFDGGIYSMLSCKVSAKAIRIMQADYVEGTKFGDDLWAECSHTLVSSHGLLCACMIQTIMDTNAKIHLDTLHKFWCSLNYSNSNQCRTSQKDVLEGIFEEIRNARPEVQRNIIETLYSKLHPEDEVVEEPEVAATRRGRPKKSNTRNKSGVEHARRKNPTSSNTTSSDGSGYGAPLDVNWDCITDIHASYLVKYIPLVSLDFFLAVFDPEGDGHCGFRVMSHAKTGTQKNWAKMRYQAIASLQNPVLRPFCFGDVNKTCRRLKWSQQRGCPKDYWMENWDLFNFATTFNWTICLVCTSYDQYETPGSATWENCSTYLPLDVGPGVREPSGILWIGFTGNHWFRLRMQHDSPMPQVHRMWGRFRQPSVAHYEEIYTERCMLWMQYVNAYYPPETFNWGNNNSEGNPFVI